MQFVRVETDGQIAVVTIDNPPVNAIAQPVRDEIADALRQLEQSEGVRVVILTGAGQKIFVAGADITEFPPMRYDAAVQRGKRVRPWWDYIATYPKPIVAALNGHALGGGLELAMCCDIRVASDAARLGLPETGLGIMPGGGGTQRLARLVGAGRAKLIILAGEQISAAEAERWGLVERVVEVDQVLAEARSIAGNIVTKGPIATRFAKQAIDDGYERPLKAGLDVEYDCFARLMDTEDKNEGIAAFLAKRRPNWQGR